MTALIQYEPFVDRTTEKFLDQTEALFSSKNAICDFSQWLQYYAFDVIGEMTYSKRHGFVDRGEDIDGVVSYLGRLFSYVAPVSCLVATSVAPLTNSILLGWSITHPGQTSAQKPNPASARQVWVQIIHVPDCHFRQSPYE